MGDADGTPARRGMAQCRICQEDAATDDLLHPCACIGSLRYVHAACLHRWLRSPAYLDHLTVAKSRPHCKVCGEDYLVRSVPPSRASFVWRHCALSLQADDHILALRLFILLCVLVVARAVLPGAWPRAVAALVVDVVVLRHLVRETYGGIALVLSRVLMGALLVLSGFLFADLGHALAALYGMLGVHVEPSTGLEWLAAALLPADARQRHALWTACGAVGGAVLYRSACDAIGREWKIWCRSRATHTVLSLPS